MRCFVAVDLDNQLKDKVMEIQQRLRIADAKLVEKENLHFTLKFLGEVSEEQTVDVKSRLSGIAKNFKPFAISLKGMGAFPSLNYIRVVWIGAPLLYNLQKAVDESLYPLFPREKEVTPHLTLARVRSPKGKDLLKEFVKNNTDLEIGSMTVSKVKLKSSKLSPKGPVYEDVVVWEL